ncbi:MAG TPA: hypothetical protein VK177_03590 [Flavobacteriales bacterium]|nr:hypothetical protein [Flavobacteriales bacterium]
MKSLQREHSIFILLGGFLLAVINLAVMMIMIRWELVSNIYIFYVISYAIEFGLFCLALYFYRLWIHKVVWFSQGFLLLILLTGFKILLASLFVYGLFMYMDILSGSAVNNLIGVAGIFMRGFIIELPLIALAAKLMETDIFDKPESRNEKILDDL